jgi:hypothetical protein
VALNISPTFAVAELNWLDMVTGMTVYLGMVVVGTDGHGVGQGAGHGCGAAAGVPHTCAEAADETNTIRTINRTQLRNMVSSLPHRMAST